MKYLIIGAGVAGITASKKILNNKDDEDEITVITDESYPFYYRPKLIEYLSGNLSIEDIIIHDKNWFKEKGINFRENEEVKSIKTDEKILTTSKNQFHYDKLLIASGSHSFVPPIDGHKKKNIFTLRNIEDAKKIHEKAINSEKGVVIGGGLLGLESAYNLKKTGLETTVIEVFDNLLPKQLDEKGGKVLQKILEEKGLKFQVGADVNKFKGKEKVKNVKYNDTENLETDLVLISAGVRPNTELVKKTDIKVNNGIVVNNSMETSAKNVYAAGDIAEHEGNIYGLWTASKVEGRIAGLNMVNNEERFTGFVPSHSLKVAGVNVISVGEIEPEGDYEEEIYEDKRSYKKVVKKNGEPIGAIFVGDKYKKDSNKIVDKIKKGN